MGSAGDGVRAFVSLRKDTEKAEEEKKGVATGQHPPRPP